MNPVIRRAVAFGIGVVAAFSLGLEMGNNQGDTRADRQYAEILVGNGCEGQLPGALVLMSEEDGFAMPCKEIERARVSIQSLREAQ